jgi:hypothetical protein
VTIARRIPRPSTALVVAFAALFTALSGTGYAALKITGKDVAKSTLTGKHVKNKSLGSKEHKPDSLGGGQIDEASLGTVPTAAKAADADTLGGNAASAFMTKQPRLFEAAIPFNQNFANNAVLGTLADLAPGAYVVTAKLTYENDGATNTSSCTLHVPGGNDVTTFAHDGTNSETITLQKVTSSGAVFSPSVTCESDGGDDIIGVGNIIAVRVD